jgi:ankyrin repeat protein
MPRTILLTLLSILIIMFTGCSGNNKGSKNEASTSPQKTGTTAQNNNVENTPPSTQQSGQTAPGSGPVLHIDQLLEAALNGNLQAIEKAIENGFDVETTDDQKHTVLMMAAYNGHSNIVQLVLDKGASVDHRDIMNRTALMYASTGPFNETVTLLLDAGADPNLVDGDEHFTPLMFAAAEGQAEVVATLLEYGANKSMVDVDGDSAYDFALSNGHSEVAKMLK